MHNFFITEVMAACAEKSILCKVAMEFPNTVYV